MSRWDEFLNVVSSIDLKWPKLRPALVVLALVESDHCTTELATKHFNPFAMPWYRFNNLLGCKVRDTGFASFPSFNNAILAWENWINNDDTFKNHPEYFEDSEVFLSELAKQSVLNYAKYGLQEMISQAQTLLVKCRRTV